LTAVDSNSWRSILDNATIDGSITSTIVAGLQANTTYTFTMTAVDSSGARSLPATVSFTTAAGCEQLPTSPPRVAEAVEAKSLGQTVTLSWQAPPDGPCASSYSVTLQDGNNL
jgi:chitodextrinase